MARGTTYLPHDSAAYGDAFADVYDDWYRELGQPADVVDALARLVPETGSLIELGVGTGRLALPLMAAGWDVVGVDSSPAMLDGLRAKVRDRPGGAAPGAIGSIELHAGDVTTSTGWPDLHADVVLASFNLLLNLVDRAGQATTVALAADHLAPGGLLVCETQVLDLRAAAADATVTRRDGVAIHTVVDRARGVVEGTHVAPDGTERRWRLRAIAPAELDALAVAAGLTVEARWNAWDGAAFVPGHSQTAISIYRRTEPAP
jgi:hypothetical protein